MKYLKILGKALLIIMGIILISTFIITIFNYFNIISDKTNNVVLLTIAIIAMIIGGFQLGRETNKKGWLEGLKLSLCIIVLFILFSILGLKYNYKLNNFLYYGILMISSMFGSIIGVNKKKKH